MYRGQVQVNGRKLSICSAGRVNKIMRQIETNVAPFLGVIRLYGLQNENAPAVKAEAFF